MGPEYIGDVKPVNAYRRAGVWLQFNCALFPDALGGTGYVPWADLLTTIEQWRAEDRFRRFFFVRKPPGLRLRFFGENLDERLLPPLVAWLDEAERLNAIRGYRTARYEPERARFGGPMGMDIAHDAFDRDSRHVMRYAGLSRDAQLALSRRAFSLLLANDLFGRRIADIAELWDIWQRLSRVVGDVRAERATTADDVALALVAFSDVQAVLARVPADAATLLTDAWQDNAEIIARLHASEQTGGLRVGPRAWLASVCLFHWNRLAFERCDLGEIVGAMLRLFTLPEHDA